MSSRLSVIHGLETIILGRVPACLGAIPFLQRLIVPGRPIAQLQENLRKLNVLCLNHFGRTPLRLSDVLRPDSFGGRKDFVVCRIQ